MTNTIKLTLLALITMTTFACGGGTDRPEQLGSADKEPVAAATASSNPVPAPAVSTVVGDTTSEDSGLPMTPDAGLTRVPPDSGVADAAAPVTVLVTYTCKVDGNAGPGMAVIPVASYAYELAYDSTGNVEATLAGIDHLHQDAECSDMEYLSAGSEGTQEGAVGCGNMHATFIKDTQTAYFTYGAGDASAPLTWTAVCTTK